MRIWLALAAAAACLGCDNFTGDEGRIQFQTSLTRPLAAWTPASPVAAGTPFSFRAVGFLQDDGGWSTALVALPSVDDPTLLTELDAGSNRLTGVAIGSGRAQIDWSGVVSDRFTLRAEEAASAALSDPILFRDTGLTLTSGRRWADVGSSLALANGSSLYLDVVLRGADGGWLAHAPGLVTARSTGAVTARADGFGVIVSAADGGAAGELVLETDAGGLASVAVRAVPADQVVELELTAYVAEGQAWFKVTGLLDGGVPLWQAPVAWAFDPRLSIIDHPARFPTAPPRVDLLGLSWTDLEGPASFTTVVAAKIGEATVSFPFLVEVPAPPPEPDAGLAPRRPPVGCGCAGGSCLAVPGAWSFVALLLSAARRRHGKSSRGFRRREPT